ncbi:hypothetical protein VNO78_31186 [Psophocarpus tetragonolobus]|uniref:Uncharacterized protein n=1 Tax=Psophocarpus tetragonolobus TaxID=3891 RepID=A0AAN9RY00_PSOTE
MSDKKEKTWMLKKRNEELEEELRKCKEREENVKQQLCAVLDRLRVAEDAEERLCWQLAELEAEAVVEAREYQAQIVALLDQLSRPHSLPS